MDNIVSKKIHKRQRDDDDDDEDENEVLIENDEAVETVEDAAAVKARIVAKAEKKFSMALIERSKELEWEEHDIARLVLLISKERELDSNKTLKLLQRCEVCTPIVLATLADEDYVFSSSQLIGALYDQAGHVDKFIQVIEDSLEQGLLNITDDGTIDALFNTAESSMNPQQFRRFARGICDHSKSRKLCGRVLNGFACRMTSSEACSFISDIVSYDFFLDLPGSMKSFYREMPEIGEQVESFLSTTRTMDREGNIVDSDEDEAGNLRGFIDDDMGDTQKGPKRVKNQFVGDRDSDTESYSSQSSSDNSDEDTENEVDRDHQGDRREGHISDRGFGHDSDGTATESENSDDDDNAEPDYEIDIASGSDSGQDNDNLDEDKTAIETMQTPESASDSDVDGEEGGGRERGRDREERKSKSKSRNNRDESDDGERGETGGARGGDRQFVESTAQSQRNRRVIADDDDDDDE